MNTENFWHFWHFAILSSFFLHFFMPFHRWHWDNYQPLPAIDAVTDTTLPPPPQSTPIWQPINRSIRTQTHKISEQSNVQFALSSPRHVPSIFYLHSNNFSSHSFVSFSFFCASFSFRLKQISVDFKPNTLILFRIFRKHFAKQENNKNKIWIYIYTQW